LREATDLGVSAGVRRELSGRRIDLTKLKFPVKNGVVTIEGELSFVGMEKSSDETAIELKFLESGLKAIFGVKEIIFAFTNWAKNDHGGWESSDAKASAASAPVASGDGLVCPDCDCVIRFCPCCGKPLAGAGKGAPSRIKKPAPPIKPMIKKKKPIGPVSLTPSPAVSPFSKPAIQPVSAPATHDSHEQTDNLLKPQFPSTAKPQPVYSEPLKPASNPEPIAEPEKKPVIPAETPLKHGAPAIATPGISPATPAKPAVATPVRHVAPVGPVSPARPVQPTVAPVATAPVPKAPTETFDPFAKDLSEKINADSSLPSETDSSTELSDFDAGTFDLKQVEPAAKTEPSAPPSVPDLDSFDISSFTIPVPPRAAPVEEPHAPADDLFAGFTQSPGIDKEENPVLHTEPADINERCNFPTTQPEPEATHLPPVKPMLTPAKPIAPPRPGQPKPAGKPPLPQLKPQPAPGSFSLDEETPLPPIKPAPAAPVADPFNLDDDTPLPPMKPASTGKPASKDPFAALFADSGADLGSGAGKEKGKDPFASLDLDLDVLEIFPSNDAPAPTPAPKPGKPGKPGAPAAPAKPVDDNPFNLDNVIDLDSPIEDSKEQKGQKGKKAPFDLDDFDISKFKL